jgi:hypothetical protein
MSRTTYGIEVHAAATNGRVYNRSAGRDTSRAKQSDAAATSGRVYDRSAGGDNIDHVPATRQEI